MTYECEWGMSKNKLVEHWTRIAKKLFGLGIRELSKSKTCMVSRRNCCLDRNIGEVKKYWRLLDVNTEPVESEG